MTYAKGPIPPNISENAAALDAAKKCADHLSSLGAKVQWIRGMQAYSPLDDRYIARVDVAVASPDGEVYQFVTDYADSSSDFKNPVFADVNEFGRLYRIALWTSAVKSALVPAIASAFPKYKVHINSEIGVDFAYRDGELIDHNRIPRRMKGFIAGFLAAWEVTAPRPDTAKTSPSEPQTHPQPDPPEPQP